ncbi:MAG TPA: class I SAM-dependent methyltransferase [Bryobacteraceae bacterium]|jgi:SAM-dependent methyltransferase
MTAYDQLPYINHPYVQTHPDHMAVLARLHGLDAPSPLHARVLDIGTSEGGNLIPLAITMPEADLVGIDLASIPLDRGRAVIEALGLRNVQLQQLNLLEMDESFGTFDYIVAHGLYGWTPPQIGDRLLAVIRQHLRPNGIAFVSYNTMPGGHLRQLIREMMLFHADRFQDPAHRIAASRAMMELVAEGVPDPDPIEQAVAYQASAALDRTDSSLYHDFLAPVFQPVYFRDFAEHALAHALTYVADASVADTYNMKLSKQALEAVGAAGRAGRIFQEQFLDLLRVRRFRRSLLCHHALQPVAKWDASRAAGLHASSAAELSGENEFSTPGGIRITVTPDTAAFLEDLIQRWPASRPLDPPETDLAVELYRRDLIELSTFPSAAVKAGDKPAASPLVRYQAQQNHPSVSTLRHRALSIEDESGRRLLSLLDGTRDRGQLAMEMSCSVGELQEKLTALERHAILMA